MKSSVKRLSTLIGVLCLLVLLLSLLSACSFSPGRDPGSEPTTEAVAGTVPVASGQEEGTGSEEAEAETEEPDALETIIYRVGKIREKAEAEAPKADKAKLNEGANYIKDHYKDCYDSPGSMEHMIYYGYLLYYRFEDGSTIGDMGHSGATAAELVYRQEETADSPTVKAYMEDVEACIRDLKEGE